MQVGGLARPDGTSLEISARLRDGTPSASRQSSAPSPRLIGSGAGEGRQPSSKAAKMSWLWQPRKFPPIGLGWHTTGSRPSREPSTRTLRSDREDAAQGGASSTRRIINDHAGHKCTSIRGYRGSNDIQRSPWRARRDRRFRGLVLDLHEGGQAANICVTSGSTCSCSSAAIRKPPALGLPSALDLVTDPKDRQVGRI